MQSIEELLKDKKISKEEIKFDQIEKQFKRALKDFDTTRFLLEYDRETAYTICYNSMLHMGRCLMFCMGYRPKGEGKHRITVEFCSAVLGDKYKVIISKYDDARQKRNKLVYEVPEWEIAENEVLRLLDIAEELKNIIIQKIKEINPQLELFD